MVSISALLLIAFGLAPARGDLVDAGSVFVDVNTESLVVGSTPATLPNTGVIAGDFSLVNQVGQPKPETVEITDGGGVTLKGIHLNREQPFQNVYQGPVTPNSLTAAGASRSIEIWANNPEISNNGEEMMVGWGRRGGGDGTNMSFGFTNQAAFGAVGHWGGGPDAPWGAAGAATPTAGDWHHLVYTYDGSSTRLYSDGAFVYSESTGSIDTHDGFPFIIGGQNAQNAPHSPTVDGVGAGSFGGNFRGVVSRVRIHDGVLSAAEVLNNFNFGPAQSSGPTINGFTATPAETFEGDSATLAWEITDTTGTLTVSIAPAPGAIGGNPALGSVEVSPLATTTYTLTATNSDGSRTAEITVSVDPSLPVADGQSVATDEQVAKNITLVANDPNGGTLNYLIVDPPGGGALSGSVPNLIYTPDVGFVGADSFTFRANDGTHDSNLATVSITVNAAAVAPSDITLTSTQIPSTAVPGSFIADIIAVDVNLQDTHAFALVAGAGDRDNALFSTSANDLLAESNFAAQIGSSFNIRLRAIDNTGSSFEKAIALTVVEASAEIVINEIHYDPENGALPGEFIELYNPGNSAVDLSAWFFEDGIDFTLPGGTTLGAGDYLVVAQNPATALALYGVTALGPWVGKLDSDGEKVTLRDSAGHVIDVVNYKVGFPWPIAPSGDGGSMELLHPSLDNDLGSSWRVSRPPGDLPEATLLPLGSTDWSWRPR